MARLRAEPLRIVFFGTYDEGLHPRIAALREGLVAHGHEIVVCNEPSGVGTDARLAVARRPWTAVRLVWSFGRTLRSLRRRVRDIGPVDAVLVGYLGIIDVHLARRWFDAPVVLDHLAPVSGTLTDRRIGGARRRLAEAADRRAEHAADLLLADTEEHLEMLPERSRSKAIVVPVGAPSRWFEARRSALDRSETGRLSVVFFGLYTPLQGIAAIADAIERVDHELVHWTLIGTGQDRSVVDEALSENSNVQLIDWVDPEKLPAVVADHDVCLGIFGGDGKALRVVPNKVFQGAAAGCVVVTSDTDCQRRALGPSAVLVDPMSGEQLADAVVGLATDRAALHRSRVAAAAWADEHFRPVRTVVPLVERLRSVGPGRA